MRITEDKLRELLKEAVHEALTGFLSENSLILEMARQRGEYKDSISNILPQILENWCLITFSILTNGNENTRIHWGSELIAHLKRASKVTMKGNDSHESRESVFNEIMFKERLRDQSRIDKLIRNKFRSEKFNVNSPAYIQTIDECINNLWVIFYKILDRNDDEISNYVRKLTSTQ